MRREGFTPASFARKADVRPGTIYDGIKGRHRVSLEVARKLAAAAGYEVPAARIMGLTAEDIYGSRAGATS